LTNSFSQRAAVASADLLLSPLVPTYYLKCSFNERIDPIDGACKPCLLAATFVVVRSGDGQKGP
ncbi:MAG: hypothetical protein ACPIOQ_26435, partial [Promethearchaeia archaeon]